MYECVYIYIYIYTHVMIICVVIAVMGPRGMRAPPCFVVCLDLHRSSKRAHCTLSIAFARCMPKGALRSLWGWDKGTLTLRGASLTKEEAICA